MSAFLDNLKEGDLVVIDHSFGNIRLSTVTRLTNTLVVIGNIRFSRKTGYAVGQRHFMSRHFLRQPTPEMVTKIKRAEAIDKLRHADFTNTETERLMAAVAALGL